MTEITPLLASEAEPTGCDQQRTAARSNMFAAAALYHATGSVPVRLRNMSRNGALVEGATLPAEAAIVRLCRGSLVACGQIAWQRGNRAGIRFDATVDVADWLPKGRQPSGQDRVDVMVHVCRTATAVGLGPETAPPPALAYEDAIRQLLDLREALNTAAEELAGNQAVAVGHAGALQVIDATAQRISRLAASLAPAGQIPPATGS